jgi:hypothetical protein
VKILSYVKKFVVSLMSVQTAIYYDLVRREHHAYPLLLAFLQAKTLGRPKITLVELGVAGGVGLLNICKVADQLRKETGIEYEVVGFDTGEGLPAPQGYKDHPELWSQGMFPTSSVLHNLPPDTRVEYGDVKNTVKDFVPSAPIAFVSIDLDYYSSTKDGLEIFKKDPSNYLPAVMMYVDDVEEALTYNSWCGEALAIREFNEENRKRKIERKIVRPDRKPKWWHNHIYCCHVLDHPLREGGGTDMRSLNVRSV